MFASTKKRESSVPGGDTSATSVLILPWVHLRVGILRRGSDGLFRALYIKSFPHTGPGDAQDAQDGYQQDPDDKDDEIDHSVHDSDSSRDSGRREH